MRHMVRLYVDGLPPDLFHQRRRSSTIRPLTRGADLEHPPPSRSCFLGPLGHVINAGTARPRPFSIFAFYVFRCLFAASAFSKARQMRRRIDLFEATMQGYSRLDPAQRERFFQAGLKAALRLERQEFREWLMRRLIEPPLAAPVDPASFAISKADVALLVKSAREAPFK
ncbi:hypothetical protein [Bradyrhizobium sp. S3.9.1]|uniref:hypothetical protein n=1 Tax=Bradyrhizobium sp. S3.9.1 TaxID=3156431 RepID=UPI00339A5812